MRRVLSDVAIAKKDGQQNRAVAGETPNAERHLLMAAFVARPTSAAAPRGMHPDAPNRRGKASDGPRWPSGG